MELELGLWLGLVLELGLKLGVMVKAEVSFRAGDRVMGLELGLGLELGSELNQSLSCGRPIACSYRLRTERHERFPRIDQDSPHAAGLPVERYAQLREFIFRRSRVGTIQC